MAKAALYSGARLLMDKFEVDNVDRIVLAGAFGAHISPKHAMALGMIPRLQIEQMFHRQEMLLEQERALLYSIIQHVLI